MGRLRRYRIRSDRQRIHLAERGSDPRRSCRSAGYQSACGRHCLCRKDYEAGVPLFVDPISAAKAAKITKILPYVTVLKPNKQEAETLSGRPILTTANAEDAALTLLGLGVKEVYLTLGKKGVIAGASGQDLLRMPGFALHPVNTSGCGDAFVSAVIHTYLQGGSLRDKTRAGIAAASISMETKSAVNPILTAEALQERMKLVE